jgi:hypothetical protein
LGSDRKDFNLIEYHHNLTLHNNPAYKVVYFYQLKVGVNIGAHYETMRLWIMKADDVYTLVFVTQPLPGFKPTITGQKVVVVDPTTGKLTDFLSLKK